jgi:hypothetical protein
MKRLFLRAFIGLGCLSLFAPTVSAGVFAYYSFDTNFADGSGNGRNGTFTEAGTGNVLGNSGITTTSGNYIFGGGGLNIVGEAGAPRDYVAVSPSTFTNADTFTMAFWARRSPGDTSGPYQWDMVIGSTANTGNFIALHDGSNSGVDSANEGVFGALRLRTGGINPPQQSDWLSINETDTAWHHHVVVMNGADDTSSYYLDGVLVSTQTGKSSSPFTYNAIAASYTDTADYDFRGQLDEFWIFDQALTGTEVSSLMNINAIPEPSTVVAGVLGLCWLGVQVRKRRRP